MRFIICMRPLKWFLRRDWYSVRRYNSEGEEEHLLDLGALTIGWART